MHWQQNYMKDSSETESKEDVQKLCKTHTSLAGLVSGSSSKKMDAK
jgi:hypothetical protein